MNNEFIDRKFRINERYFRNLSVISECVDESLGISNEVSEISHDIMSEVRKTIKNCEYKKYCDGLYCSINKSKVEDINLSVVILKSNNINLIDDFKKRFNITYRAKYIYSENTILVIIDFLNGYIDFPKIYGNIQHEVEHYYEFFKQGYVTDDNLYKKSEIFRKSKAKLEKCIGNLLYYCNSHEINAFENEAYRYCIEKYNDDGYNFFRDTIQDTNLFKMLSLCDKCWNIIENSNDEAISDIGFQRKNYMIYMLKDEGRL